MIIDYCSFDYITIKPLGLAAPDLNLPHGTSYSKSLGGLIDAGADAGNSTAMGISLTHSDMWGYDTGIVLGSNSANSAHPALIKDNWMHDQGLCNGTCTTHDDGIGMVDTGQSSSYVTLDHNNMPFIQDNTNDIAFQSGTYDHLTITTNIFSGDGYTIAVWASSTNITFTGNVMTNYGQPYYGFMYPQSFWTSPDSTWAHNHFVWDPTGVTPFYMNGPGNGNSGQLTAADSGKCWVPSGLSTTDYGGGAC